MTTAFTPVQLALLSLSGASARLDDAHRILLELGLAAAAAQVDGARKRIYDATGMLALATAKEEGTVRS